MDQLDLAVARQMAAERHEALVREAERRRLHRERAAAQSQPTAPTHGPVPAAPRLSLRAWLASHLHVALHRPAAR